MHACQQPAWICVHEYITGKTCRLLLISTHLFKDWAISRNRFWGTPIPLWCSEDMEERVAIGSIAQLEELSGITVRDAWVMCV